MSNELTIPKEISAQYGTSYERLRNAGMRHIEQLSGKLWTDYNTHDPGITFLELLCYALTDLEYRIRMPMQDVVASPDDNLSAMHRQFHSALEVLPNAPVTAHDFRKILVRVAGVKNVWLHKHQKSIMATFKPQPIQVRYAKEGEQPVANEAVDFPLKGLYDLLIEFDEHAYDGRIPLADWKAAVIRDVTRVFHRFRALCEDVEAVKEVPVQEVVLCADIALAPDADPEKVWARIAFEVARYLSPDIRYYTLAEMQASGKSSDELFEGPVFDFDALSVDDSSDTDLFFKKGFIDDDDVKNSSLRTHLRLSDIIRVVSKIEGVQFIKNIAFAFCGCDETDKAKVAQLFNKDTWLLCIKAGHKPVLCLDNTILNFYKDVIPIQLKKEEASAALAGLHEAHRMEVAGKYIEDLPMPEGRYRNPGDYTTVQNQLPETYAVGQAALPDSAGTVRKAQAKQLKAYLYFFDQVLANYFAQLAHVKDLLSADNDLTATYFSNAVNQLKDRDDIVDDGKAKSDRVMAKLGLDDYPKRSNQLLDHLLARFNEQFGDYVFLLHRIYGDDFNYASIRHKKNFYKDYNAISSWRGTAFDYYNPKNEENDAVNISGMEKRISRLLGFNQYKRQHLAGLPYRIQRLVPADSSSLYTWQIQQEGVDILIGSGTAASADLAYEELGMVSVLAVEENAYGFLFNHDLSEVRLAVKDSDFMLAATSVYADHTTDFSSLNGAFAPSDAVRAAILGMAQRDIRFRLAADKKRVTFDLLKGDEVMASCPCWFAVLTGEAESGSYAQAQPAIDQLLAHNDALVHYLVDPATQLYRIQVIGNQGQVLLASSRRFSLQKGIDKDDPHLADLRIRQKETMVYLEERFRLEGLYVVERILLRPDEDDAASDEFMPLCVDVNGNYCKPLDPYSFRIDVVLPGYSLRLRNKYFRQFAARVIRMETPAHILPRICFVDETHIQEFEKAYDAWRTEKRKAAQENRPIDKATNKQLIAVLDRLYTVYEQGALSDCDDDTPDSNPIVLGSTFLGTVRNSDT